MIARLSAVSALAGLLLLLVAAPVQAQNATITGQVTSATSGEPISGVQVYLEGTGYNAVTGENGRYTISNVQPGTYTLVASIIGFAEGRAANFQVEPGAEMTRDFALASRSLRLQEVVVTGVSDPTEGVRTPFSVGRVSRDNLPVPPANAVSAIQGRIAGARVRQTSGQPGQGASVRLRSRTSIRSGSAPLIVIDGIVQASSTIDIDSRDIEDIEVVRGAAGASVYGSRAQNGVINITTRRGRDVAVGATRISARSEYGFAQVPQLDESHEVAKYHHWNTNEQGQWTDLDGNVVAREDRVVSPNRMMDTPFAGPLFNHLDQFLEGGTNTNTAVNLSRNTERTNFFVSVGDQREGGVIPMFNEGYQRQNFRINIDNRLRDDLTLGLSSSFARSRNDGVSGNPFFALRFIEPDIDLTRPNPDGQPWIKVLENQVEESPLYNLANVENFNYRSRTQASATLRYNPRSWVNFEALAGLDRSDREAYTYRHSDFIDPGLGTLSDGNYQRSHNFTQGVNASFTTTLIRSFGDMTVRPRVRYNMEREDNEGMSANARQLRARNVRSLSNGIEEFISGSRSETRSESVLGSVAFDYAGKWNLDALVRHDGSSRFGPDARWNTYYRMATSYNLNEELWFPFEDLTLFKPRFSIGTAGQHPGFAAQYETFSVGSAGITKGNLGNRNLRPEFSTEMEFGLDMILRDRYSLELSHIRTTTEDQLLLVPLPGAFGFNAQWQNAGTVESTAWEATFEASLINEADRGWNMGLVFDRSSAEITEYNSQCTSTGTGQNATNFYICEGENLATMYGRSHHYSHATLPDVHANSHGAFQVNDEGLLVPVGEGNSYRDQMWGTTVTIDGVDYAWGTPFLQLDEGGNAQTLIKIGHAEPSFNMGWTNTLRFGGLNIFTLVDASIGFDIYNNTRQWPLRDNLGAEQVQAGKPDELKKPVDYYAALYSTNATVAHWVEEGSFVKLREIELSYRFTQSQLQNLPMGGFGLDNLSLQLIGRNLYTITGYSGIDPETTAGGSAFLSATENPLDGFSYPMTRSFSFGISVDF
jgi:TonB-linked SusC/RagA family outer membrane protein